MKDELARQEIPVNGGGQQRLADTLTNEFNRVILPAWALMIFLESGVVSFLLGVTLFLDAPFVLIAGGLLQAVPTGLVIISRIRRNGK